ncbi:MAG: SUMF1/EgtB/PvdO family nonheme iron enzyme [Verrucomicrobiales bacterium]|nr:SUMF1/EgtB/PvdO family nonheme iron enzyme [Verrucomicrobiales bacterium]
MKLLPVALLAALPFAGSSLAAVDFKKQVRPILEVYCLKCHGDEKPKGKLSLTTRAGAIQGGEEGASLVPGDPAKSPLYTLTLLPAGHDDVMPPKGDLLTQQQQETLKQWIVEGAVWPDSVRLQQREKVDFVKQAKPIFEVYCVACHKEGHAKGDLRLDVREEFFKSPDVVPGDAMASKVYTTMVLPADHDDLMPPRKKGGPLPAAKCDVIRDWIDQGAAWPSGLVLKEREPDASSDRDWNAVIAAIHARLIKNEQAAPLAHKNYRETIHESVGFEMVAIPGGEFEMGSADNSPGHQANESPRHKVKLDPFWMGKTEVTWNEYELFQFPSMEKGANVSTERVNRELLLLTDFPRPADGGNPYVGHEADAVSRPTTPYVEMSFGMGKDGFPAISMTHYAALMYCRWLSAKTGHFYRLATEAEWEYAARAGTTTTYYWGDEPAKAGEYAWYFDNADGKYQKVGLKKPNAFGLYDMLGNVAEWVTDGYKADAYSILPMDNPVLFGFAEYPHVARGGSWDDEVDKLRCAARQFSDAAWKMRDPQLPKSRWYLTDAQFLGWRVVRPAKVPATPEELAKWWTSFPPPAPR